MAEQKTFRIELSRGAERDLKGLPIDVQRVILQEMKKWLATEPFREIKTRIKRLSGIVPTIYRLRIGDYRAYYRMVTVNVVILGILHKKDTDRWLRTL